MSIEVEGKLKINDKEQLENLVNEKNSIKD